MKTGKLILAAVAAMTVATNVLGAVVPVAADDISSTKTEVSSNKTKSAQIVAAIEAASAQVVTLVTKISDKTAAITTADAKISDTVTSIAKLDTEIATQKQEIAARKEVMRKQLVSLQKEAGDSVTGSVYVDFVLNSKSISDLISRGVTVNKLNQANKDAMDQVTEAKDKLAALQQEQQDKKDSLEATRTQLVSDKTELVALKKDMETKQKSLDKQLADNKDLLVALESKLAKATAAKEAKLKAAELAKQKAAAAKASAAEAKTSTSTATTTTASTTATLKTDAATTGATTTNYTSTGNSYSYPQCTWYAKQRSGWAGNNWGNGCQWGASAAAAGFTVNHTPAAGTIISFAAGQSVGGEWSADGSYGHVAYVESYDASSDTIKISQGGAGFDSIPNYQTISNASSYNYTYIHN